MCIAVYSPPLDSVGNSVRAVTFFKHLMQAYPCGIFDAIVRQGQQLFGATAREDDGETAVVGETVESAAASPSVTDRGTAACPLASSFPLRAHMY